MLFNNVQIIVQFWSGLHRGACLSPKISLLTVVVSVNSAAHEANFTVHTIYLDQDDAELRRAWHTFPDPAMEHYGEEWQYMGTSRRDGTWQHCFRHRCHPRTNARMKVEVAAAASWWPVAPAEV